MTSILSVGQRRLSGSATSASMLGNQKGGASDEKPAIVEPGDAMNTGKAKARGEMAALLSEFHRHYFCRNAGFCWEADLSPREKLEAAEILKIFDSIGATGQGFLALDPCYKNLLDDFESHREEFPSINPDEDDGWYADWLDRMSDASKRATGQVTKTSVEETYVCWV